MEYQTHERIHTPLSAPIISSKASIGHNVKIGPYTIIGDDVIIGDNTIIGPNVYIPQDTIIGENNKIYYGAVLGTDPQDLKYSGERSQLIIGNNNIIREYVTISRGTKGGGYLTQIGDHNMLMGHVHIGHDAKIQNHNIISQHSGFAGHVSIENHVIVGGYTGVHQFCRIGSHSMIGGCSKITKDVLPFSITSGNPAQYVGLNIVGLKRKKFSLKQRILIKKIFQVIHEQQNQEQIDIILGSRSDQCPENQVIINMIIEFLRKSTRGIYKKTADSNTLSLD